LGLKQDLVFRIAKRWIAGSDAKAGLDAAKEANGKGFVALLNYLGEDVTDAAEAERQTREYVALQKAISDAKIDGSVSVKLTQLGLLVDERVVTERLQNLASSAGMLGQRLWLDMESSQFTDQTIQMYKRLHEEHKNTGLALQAYMRRSAKDLPSLLDAGAQVRLVKGAYREPSSVVFPSKKAVSENYSSMMKMLFERGDDFTIATHDSVLVDEARKLAESHNRKFEFGMLRGIRDELKAELVASGYRVVDYIPYGDQWYAYSIRRMKEHPSNIWLLFRSLI
jgi:proline dehydrogenase